MAVATDNPDNSDPLMTGDNTDNPAPSVINVPDATPGDALSGALKPTEDGDNNDGDDKG